MALFVFLIRIVLILFVLVLASILLIQPFKFEFISMSVLFLGLIVNIWWATFHLKQKTPPALYIPRVGMFLGSTILVTGLLSLAGFYFDAGNSTTPQTSFGIVRSVMYLIGGPLIFHAAKRYTVEHTSNNDLK